MNLTEKRIFFVLTVCFFALTLAHYFSGRPLWNDETAVLSNLKTLDGVALFSTLTHSQAFPRVHLLLIQFLARPFEYHVLALRFFSLIAMSGAFLLWSGLYQRFCDRPWTALGCVWSLVASYQMTYYAAELKPYAVDVLCVALAALFFSRLRRLQSDRPSPTDAWWCVLFPALIFFSYAALFVFWIALVNLFLLSLKNRTCWPLFFFNALVSVLCFVLVVQIDLRFSVYHDGLLTYWKDYFIALDSPSAFFTPFSEGLREMGVWWFGNKKIFVQLATPFAVVFVVALLGYGARRLMADGFKVFHPESLVFVLIVELVVLSCLRKYPFTGDRVTLFLAPFVFFLIVKGLDELRRVKWLGVILIGYYGVFTLGCFVYSLVQYVGLYR